MNRFFDTVENVKLDGNLIFFEHKIKDIDKSPCSNSETLVYDFDYAKDCIVKKYTMHCLNSCDALKLLKEEKRIDFIELKSINDILKWSKIKELEELENKFRDLNLIHKITDSYVLLSTLINDRKSNFIASDRKLFNSIEKRYIIVFDLDVLTDPLIFINFSFNLLSIKSSLEKVINKEIQSAGLINISAPIIKNCKTIDDYYK